jgi:hypothetical protein
MIADESDQQMLVVQVVPVSQIADGRSIFGVLPTMLRGISQALQQSFASFNVQKKGT